MLKQFENRRWLLNSLWCKYIPGRPGANQALYSSHPKHFPEWTDYLITLWLFGVHQKLVQITRWQHRVQFWQQKVLHNLTLTQETNQLIPEDLKTSRSTSYNISYNNWYMKSTPFLKMHFEFHIRNKPVCLKLYFQLLLAYITEKLWYLKF